MGKGAGEGPAAVEQAQNMSAAPEQIKSDVEPVEVTTAKDLFARLGSEDSNKRSTAAQETANFVKSAGADAVQASGLLDLLTAAVQATATPAAREGALLAVAELCHTVGQAVEPFAVQSLLPAILQRYGDKSAVVREAAEKAGQALFAIISPQAIRNTVIPMLLRGIAPKENWQSKLGGLSLLDVLIKRAPKAVSASLPELVPAMTEIMADAKPQVKKAAMASMLRACGSLNNRDIAPFVPVLVSCLAKPSEVPDCVHKLAATTFVQAVEAPELSIMVPLLIRGLRERSTPIKRKSALIIDNMSKLVDNPADAEVFLPRLLPGLERVSTEVSDPECRGVATAAHTTLLKVGAEGSAQGKLLQGLVQDRETILSQFTRLLDTVLALKALGPNATLAASYVASLCHNLVQARDFELSHWEACVVPYVAAFAGETEAHSAASGIMTRCQEADQRAADVLAAQEDVEEGEDLCDCEFSLAYGAKILLNNTKLHLKRGKLYGLCGPNGCGKSTLMRAIANEQVDGFPPADQLRTVYVEHDIDASQSEMAVVDFVHKDPALQGTSHPEHEQVEQVLSSVGFTAEMQALPVTSLSGGWKMKLALARAMLMKADIMLLDEPTNHLDVTNVAWLINYLTHLPQVTSMIVSHDSGFLDNVCTHIIHYENRKLKTYRGNLSEFVKQKPEAQSYYELDASPLTFKLPEPGFLEGVKSKDRAILKMHRAALVYPNTTRKVVQEVSLQCALNSRVAIVGANGAGKSTIVKMLTGEMLPTEGTVWKHPNMRVAYVAQHAFHHLEKHLDQTPNEYIRWRYALGEDRESTEKATRQISEEEEKKMAQQIKMADGTKRVLDKVEGRRKAKRGYEYEVSWKNCHSDENSWLTRDKLTEMGFEKLVNEVDAKEAARLGLVTRPLTEAVVQKQLEDLGLEAAFGTHSQIRGLSGGQKVKVVLAAAMWNNPHILVLDEPTNYLDRDSLGALAGAIKEYGGGVVMITHNSEFSSAVCQETWHVADGRMSISGQSDAVKEAMKLDWKRQEEMTDAMGNTVKIKAPKKKLSNKEKKQAAKVRKARRERGEEVSDTDEDE